MGHSDSLTPVVSIICVYYDVSQYENIFHASLLEQDVSDYELLPVDNTRATYCNMKQAVASVSDRVRGKYVMLVHPDVRFPERDTLRSIVACCDEGFPEYALLGGAGMTQEGLSYASVIQGNGIQPGKNVLHIRECFSLDECIVVLPREIFETFPLADLGRTWHMYIVELCCRIRVQGKKVGLFPPRTVHHSFGTINKQYFRAYAKVAFRYRKNYPYLYTCCGILPTSATEIMKMRVHRWYWISMRKLKAFLSQNVPASRYLFQFNEWLFHARRERIRAQYAETERRLMEAEEKALVEEAD